MYTAVGRRYEVYLSQTPFYMLFYAITYCLVNIITVRQNVELIFLSQTVKKINKRKYV